MPSIMKLISLSALCIHARCSSPDTRTALCSGARNTRLDDEARSVTHPSLCSSLSCHSCDCINRLLCIFVSYIFIGLLQSVTCIFHFRVFWPQKSSKSLCVIQRISKHIWKCVKIIWGQPCKMILNFNTHFNVAKTDTRFNAQVSELKKNLTVRYSFGTPFKSSSQDNCSQKFKCQILWSSTFLHNPILDTRCSYVIQLKVFFSFLNDHLSTLPVACYFLVILILSRTSMFLPRYILLIFNPVFL